MEKIQAVRGMNDLLPEDSYHYNSVISTIHNILLSFGYDNMRTPTVEKTPVFKRAIGAVTDIVEKEMYTWQDGKESLSLRPEGTASIVRSMIEHNLPREGIQKVFYSGPMYRHERPQKGRYREFFQCGAEVFGDDSVAIEAEIIHICKVIIDNFNISATLHINTLGTQTDRESYKTELVRYFSAHQDSLDTESIQRLQTNPLRILDSKNPKMQDIITQAPKLIEYINTGSKERFTALQSLLDNLEISYTITETLVRGLDYYNDIVFEWVSDKLGAQGTICAGGRYDELVGIMGGTPSPGVGFAIGLERLLLLIRATTPAPYHFYMISSTNAENALALRVAQMLRSHFTGIIVYNDLSTKSVKNKFKKADKKHAMFALVIGEHEVTTQSVTLKHLQTSGEQQNIAISELISTITQQQLL